VAAVHKFARGIPRVINLLCEHSLINAFVEHQKPIQKETVEEVAREFQLDKIDPVAQAVASSQHSEAAPLVQSLLQNLANLIERIGQQEQTMETSRERKP